jgi:putative ABC transport system permease protein
MCPIPNLSMNLFRILLYLYPASFRSEYGEELYDVFRERRRQATNPLSILAVWVHAFFDTLVNASCVHWDILRQDLRYTTRTLARVPGFTLTAIVVTGLGIGANTAAFSVIDHVLLRPFSFADSDRLVQLWQRNAAYARFELSPPNFYDWRRLSTSFEGMSAYAPFSWNFLGEGDPRRLEGSAVTPEFFQILGVQPLLGRTFTADDAKPRASLTVVLSYSFWQSVYGGRTDILGKTIRLDNNSYPVIGVMPPNFVFPDRTGQLWVPLVLGDPPTDARDNLFLRAMGKLKPGISNEQARAEMRVIAEQLAREYPKVNEKVSAGVDPLTDQVSNQTRLLLWALFGASSCVLLIACTNLANLLLAKAIGRRKELAVRAALGAGRERLVRQLLTESLALALAGGIVGIIMAMVALPLLSAIVPARLPLREATMLDARVLPFTVLVTLATGLVFGVLPALRASRGVAHEGLAEGSRSGVGGRRERLRAVLVTAEIAISLVLLISAGLLIRALWRVQSIDPGFRADSVMTIQTWLPMPRYAFASARASFFTNVLSNVRSKPGVTNAAYISSVPMGSMGGGIWPIAGTGNEDAEHDAGGVRPAAMRVVSSGYFDTMQIPLQAGRDFSESDDINSASVAIVSESFVRRYWPGQNPLGRKFHFAFDNFPFAQQDRIVIGVVGDVRFRGLERQNEPQVYLSYKQLPDRTATFYTPKDLVVRFSGDMTTLIPSIRRIVQEADPELPISAIQTMRDVVDVQTAPRSTQIRLVVGFAALCVVLAGIGIHGLLSFTVGQRSAEFGVRIALGAQSRDIVSLVLRDGIIMAAIGGTLGVLLSYVAGRSMQALLAGISPFDPSTLIVAGVVAFGMTLSGSLLPTLRAMRIDLTTAIRME